MFINQFFMKCCQYLPHTYEFIRRGINSMREASRYWSIFRFDSRSQPVPIVLKCIPLLDVKHITNSVNPVDVEENVSHLMTLARHALEKGDTDRATAILEMGLKICEEHESYLALPFIYDLLASICFALGNLDKAEHLLVSAIEKLVQIGYPENDTQVVDFKLRLSRIYSGYDNGSMAEIGFKECLKQQREKIFDGDTSTKTGMLYVNVLFWYGLHKIRSKEHADAKILISSAYEYSLKIKGLSPYQEMVILYTLADLHMQLGENNLALQNMNSAISLGKGIGSTDIPRCYLKLAQIYMNLDALEKAKDACQEAFKLGSLFNDDALKGEAEFTLKKIERRLSKK